MPTRPSAPTSSSWIWRMPLANSPAAVLLGRPQGELEVVERGQQLLGELGHPAVGRHGGLARGALR